MFTWGSKYLFGVFVAAFLSAVVYGLVTGGGPVGVISMGYKGGVGEHTGYTILMGASLLALFLGIISVITRDGDAEDMAIVAGVDQPIAVRPPASSSIAAPLTGFGIACLALGVAVGQAFLYLGIAVLAVVAIEWMVQAWSERATGDDGVNNIIRGRILGPIQVPMLSLLAIAVMVISLSRILLAVSKTGSVVIVCVAATFIFVSAILISKSQAPRSIVSALISFGAVAVLAGGVVGAVQGERDFHHHDDYHSEDGESHSEGEGE